jgi:uncharacterized protein with PQ loop repeat
MNTLVDIEFSALILIKIAVLIFLLFYIIFAGIVVKQVRVMTETLQVGFETPIKTLALVHFIFAVITLFLAIIAL